MIDLATSSTKLPDGLLVLSERIPHIPSVSIGMWVKVGSKHEPPGFGGLAHFLEHMLFKGTENRSAFEIARAVESVGSTLDASTGRELTCYFARTIPENLPLVMDVLADLLLHPLFDEGQMDLERQVIIDEINSYEDDPDDLAHDLLARAIWNGHPLGKPVLGSVAEVSRIGRADMLGYFNEHYRAGNVMVAAAGAVNHDDLVELAGNALGFPPGENSAPVGGKLSAPPRLTHITREEGQEYICLGHRAVPYGHPDRYPLLLLASLMGGGMSSRLFQRVREERGLAYSIYSYLDTCTETGLWATCLALKPDWTEQALEVIFEEFRSLIRSGLEPGELDSVKAQVKGHTLLGLESTSTRMARLAHCEFYHGRQVTLQELVNAIDQVREEDVLRVAGYTLVPEEMSVVLVGPVEQGSLSGGLATT